MRINVDIAHNLTNDEQEVFSLVNKVINEKASTTTARVCGGWVRDKLIGIASHDIDIMLDNISGEMFANLLAKQTGSKVHNIQANPEKSKHISTCKLFLQLSSGANQEIDFAQARQEVYTEGSRIPQITPATPQEDAMRRDITINALFYNLRTSQVEDMTGMGIKDLITGTIRTPVDPLKTFADDPLRVFRCVRFSAKYNGTITDDVYAAMASPQVQDALFKKVSKERIGEELAKTLKNDNGHIALSSLQKTGIMQRLISESLVGTEYQNVMSPIDMNQNNPHHQLTLIEHSLTVLDNLLKNNPEYQGEKRVIMTLAAWTHDLGKLVNKIQQLKEKNGKMQTSYHGHEDESAKIVEHLLKYLKMDNYIQQVSGIVMHHMDPHNLTRDDQANMSTLRRFIRKMGEKSLNWMDVLNLSIADAYSKGKNVDPATVEEYKLLRDRMAEALATMPEKKPIVKPILDGNEVIQLLNIKPGPQMKQISEFVKALRDDKPDITKEEAAQMVKDKFGGAIPSDNPPKTASKTTIAECSQYLLALRRQQIVDAIRENNTYMATIVVHELIQQYPEDTSVLQLASMVLFHALVLDKSSRDNNLLQYILDKASNNFSDPSLMAYTVGILLLIQTGTPDKAIYELGQRVGQISPNDLLHVLKLLPQDAYHKELAEKMYEEFR